MIGTAWISCSHGNRHSRSLDLTAGGKQDRLMSRQQQAPIEHGAFARDDLGPQPRQVADVLVLPEQHRVERGRGHRLAGLLDALLAQPVGIGTVLVVRPELAMRELREVAAWGPLGPIGCLVPEGRARRTLNGRYRCRGDRLAAEVRGKARRQGVGLGHQLREPLSFKRWRGPATLRAARKMPDWS